MRRNPNDFVWADEHVERLTQLWTEGLSASECGRRIGVSRNSVIGKIHRLGLSYQYRRPREGRRGMSKPQIRTNKRPLPAPEPYQAPPPPPSPAKIGRASWRERAAGE